MNDAACLLSHGSRLAAALTGVLVVALGCDSPPPPPETVVTGTITYQGKPVTGGTVIFRSSDPGGRPYSGIIRDDGTYEVSYIVPGEMAIAVETETKKGLPTFVKIPQKYSSPSQSRLKYTVVEGPQTHPIVLE